MIVEVYSCMQKSSQVKSILFLQPEITNHNLCPENLNLEKENLPKKSLTGRKWKKDRKQMWWVQMRATQWSDGTDNEEDNIINRYEEHAAVRTQGVTKYN